MKLYVVPTPVGNLEDMTFRAIQNFEIGRFSTAREREQAAFAKAFEIKTPMHSHHKFNEHKTVENVVQRIKSGQTVALISDAGTPAIRARIFSCSPMCRKRHRGRMFAGCNSFVPALVASGLPNDRFCFEGFTTKKDDKQRSTCSQQKAAP